MGVGIPVRWRSRHRACTTIAAAPRFHAGLRRLAEQSGCGIEQISTEAERDLAGIVAGNSRAQTEFTVFVSRQIYTQGYDRQIDVDPEQIERVRAAMQQHPTVTLASHRSYLDGMVLPALFSELGLPGRQVLVGGNMDFWPVGPIMRRAGGIFVRRDGTDAPVYRFALREYIGHLIEQRSHLEWFIEGGRSRTGKLLPPKLGALSYVVDAYREGRAEDVMLIPISITYDQLREAKDFAGEAGGRAKQAENTGWLLRYWRELRDRYGKIYVRFGEPLSLRAALGPPAPAHGAESGATAVQELAFEVSRRISQVTPATGTALVAVVLLGAVDRALTLRQIRAALAVVLEFAHRHDLPMTDSARGLQSAAGVQAALDALIHHGVVTRFDDGTEPVFGIEPGQHLVAAFYRNAIIHAFLNNAVLEVALIEAAKPGVTDPGARFLDVALALRDLLQFDFFFAERDDFGAALTAELALYAPDWREQLADGPAGARRILDAFPFPVAHVALRPFLEAYLVVAHALEQQPGPLQRRPFLKSCLGLGRQLLLQRIIARPESVSQQLFESGWRLAQHRGLLDTDQESMARRVAFTAELQEILADITVIGDIAADRFAVLLAGDSRRG
ncbi:1-acyl-sn-glycerol-3-phosphate acyltransferase [Mycobacterium sp. M1]|uniref:1-acyl-sn-glycerol-3-phosphate acyltransferase n=1 Tax=Mycolicibacter acidiphilus TaxID=2835306 RepID=A0ABS5RJL3_9MYCO|nr:1-acyl-sn-glycerol-3-phosphate acyltransferase [Mycolicibacter acidiphilus]MBS9534431.1 1-acyl-sn-glycerol-3-phosphate acyltransferase [Mycolicibacter acidiphilus]